MTPAARVCSAIEVLDAILSGTPTEQALTRWARGNRFAGSKDRAAIRDYVFDAVRCRRSYAALGGSETGRGLILGGLRTKDIDARVLFDGSKYGAATLSDAELAVDVRLSDLRLGERLDLQDWVWELFAQDLGEAAFDAADTLRKRANIFLRVNLSKCDVSTARTLLKEEGIETDTHALSETALLVLSNARRIALTDAYKNGMVELQDSASQAVCDFLKLPSSGRILDFCAGGGGKSLAMAAQTKATVFAHDANAKRMSDLLLRASRANADVQIIEKIEENSTFDLVLCDVPCSGSGSWRRSPDGKWSLTTNMLESLRNTQLEILTDASGHVSAKGELAYATCSVFSSENSKQISMFLNDNPEWSLIGDRQFLPQDGGDGFYVARLTRA